MQCQSCNEHSATVHLTEITGGQRIEKHMCEQCAQKQGLAVKNHIPLNELLSTLLSVQSQTPAAKASGQPQPELDEALTQPCPSCGMTLEQFTKESLLGCPCDYEFFGENLELIINKAQDGAQTHCGKVPTKTPSDTKKQIETMNLQKQLDQAVANEDYELAAKLRDKIGTTDEDN